MKVFWLGNWQSKFCLSKIYFYSYWLQSWYWYKNKRNRHLKNKIATMVTKIPFSEKRNLQNVCSPMSLIHQTRYIATAQNQYDIVYVDTTMALWRQFHYTHDKPPFRPWSAHMEIQVNRGNPGSTMGTQNWHFGDNVILHTIGPRSTHMEIQQIYRWNPGSTNRTLKWHFGDNVILHTIRYLPT